MFILINNTHCALVIAKHIIAYSYLLRVSTEIILFFIYRIAANHHGCCCLDVCIHIYI